MLWFCLFFCELLILFLLSRQVTKVLSIFLYAITKSQQITILCISLLFFPGTLIHELAHAISAGLLGVPVGKMEFVPKIDGNRVKLGSVQIGHTDPIRRFLIGSAPFLTGTALLLGILYLAAQQQWFDNALVIIAIAYAAFEIGNTMFSSKKDMEGALELFSVLLLIVLFLYLLGVRIPALNPTHLTQQPLIAEMLKRGSIFLLVPLLLDVALILLLRPFIFRRM